MVAKPGTDTIEPTFKLMMIRTNIAPSHDVAHCRLLLIRTALCRDWLRGFYHGNDVCGYIAAVPGGAFGNIITRLLKLAPSTHGARNVVGGKLSKFCQGLMNRRALSVAS